MKKAILRFMMRPHFTRFFRITTSGFIASNMSLSLILHQTPNIGSLVIFHQMYFMDRHVKFEC